ncbi:MAG: class I SAM-dependent methyltransferase [Rickettsiales bacterium]|jgi:2-polyprenyl-3-methyl-5-hydroxy-6-metoxy-1,4-benzoquinol methylase|nr:class I SAM-dependent methyltransferase [Rickettsiales bacterium]
MNETNVYKSYEKIASWFDKHRCRDLFEKPYLDMVIDNIKPNGKVLDLGCGMGEPIGKYFIDNGYQLTGIDGSKKLIDIAKSRFPNTEFLVEDMRECNLDQEFHAIIAWHSFFHLTQNDQRKMFQVFENHILPNGVLLFTSGTNNGEVWSNNGGESLYHASLSPDEYKNLLAQHNFRIIKHNIEDRNCGDATVWVAKHIDK